MVSVSAAARYRDDGTAPTSTVGFPLAANEKLIYDGDLAKFQIISQAGTITVDYLFYRA